MRISRQIFPRPVALVCAKDNLMTASFLMPISFDPKYIAVSISPKRYTWELLQETEYFSLNLLKINQIKVAWECGTVSGRKENKWKLAGITKEMGKFCATVRESPISFECKLEFSKLFGDHHLVVGRVLNELVRETDFTPLMHISGKVFARPEPV